MKETGHGYIGHYSIVNHIFTELAHRQIQSISCNVRVCVCVYAYMPLPRPLGDVKGINGEKMQIFRRLCSIAVAKLVHKLLRFFRPGQIGWFVKAHISVLANHPHVHSGGVSGVRLLLS